MIAVDAENWYSFQQLARVMSKEHISRSLTNIYVRILVIDMIESPE